MALPEQQIDSMIEALSKFGDDGIAFDAWMDTVTPYVRAHGHVGQFRTTARGLWLTNNKKGVEKLLKDLLMGPNIAERAALEKGDLVGGIAEDAFYRFLSRMGIRRGDTLTVHSSEGEIVPLKFDDERLIPRAPARKTAPKKEAEAPAPKKRQRKTRKKEEPKTDDNS